VRSARRLPWLVLVAVLVAALVAGTGRHHAPSSEDGRVRHIAAQVRCPTCQGQSAAESEAASSQAIREEIRSRLRQGQSESQIKAYLVSRFGRDILEQPATTGVAGLVWLLPLLALAGGAAGLAVAFRRWRARAGVPVSAADRALVEEALAAEAAGP